MASKSQPVSVSKNKLAETAVAAGVVGVESQIEGAEQMVEGVETLQTAAAVGPLARRPWPPAPATSPAQKISNSSPGVWPS